MELRGPTRAFLLLAPHPSWSEWSVATNQVPLQEAAQRPPGEKRDWSLSRGQQPT